VHKQILLWLMFTAIAVPAQAQESGLQADFRGEGERLKKSCFSFDFKSLGSCAQVLFTDHPLHIAAGSIAPQNGFGAGAAFVAHWTPNETWRLNWNADAVASPNGSWRAGIYMKAIRVPTRSIVVTTGTPGEPPYSNLAISDVPFFNLYAQATSLNKVYYFGLGPSTTRADRSVFGMSERIFGTNVVWPVFDKLNLSLYGEANGRFVDIRGNHGESSPSIETLYTETTAPGLTTQPGFAQFGEGIRLRPRLLSDYLRLNYFVNFQQFVGGDSTFSFRRLSVDLAHQIPLYRKTTRTLLPRDNNGPDACAVDSSSDAKCPAVTRDLEGSVNLRFFLSDSFTSTGSVVPFYFQPTLGGSNVNGNSSLPAFQDYRFRAPNVLFFHEAFEHSIWNLPIGVAVSADQGKVALTRDDFSSSPWLHTYSAGLTLRAGGFPQVYLLFSWGGGEGTHTSASINTSLLGGSVRPSLF
jgi:hypothetical protein